MENHHLLSLLLIIFPFLVKHLLAGCRRRSLNLPPGPPALPILGNLTQLGPSPHRSLRRLAQRYGPLMRLKLGQLPTVVVSSADAAKQVLKTQDLSFCTRPPLSAARSIYYGGLDVAFAPYSDHWRQAKRICTAELLSATRVRLLRPIREEEVVTFVSAIRRHSDLNQMVNLSDMFFCLTNIIACREIFGKRFAEDGECGRSRFHELVTGWTSLMGHFNVGEYFPSFEWINLFTGLHERFKNNFADMDGFLDGVIDDHLADREKGLEPEDEHVIIGVLLKLQADPSLDIPLTREHIKAILMDLFIAGSDAPALVLEWGMAELMRHPSVMKKAQEEVRSIMGKKAKVDDSDLDSFKYLKLVIKEIFRLHPPAAFLLPRESRTDCVVGGFDIPARTRVTVNAWAIGRDPAAWDEAERFWPERFEGRAVDYRGQHFELLPFGSGRRGCPGVSMAAAVVELALATVLREFDWAAPEEIDMEEDFGIVLRKKSPLLLVATPRPHRHAEGGMQVTAL